MKPLSIEQLAEIRQNAAHEACKSNSATIHEWGFLGQDAKDVAIAGMRAAISAYLASFEGMPSVEEVRIMSFRGNTNHTQDCEDVRLLCLSAHATQMEAKEAELCAMREKLSAVAKLPEKWQYYVRSESCVKELESALSTEPTPDLLAEVKAAHARGERIENSHKGGPWRLCVNPFWLGTDQYRIAPKEEWIPLGPEDVPPGSVFRLNKTKYRASWLSCIGVMTKHVILASTLTEDVNHAEYSELSENWQILRPGSTWQPCRKLKEAAL
jgi:hypothetical protein